MPLYQVLIWRTLVASGTMSQRHGFRETLGRELGHKGTYIASIVARSPVELRFPSCIPYKDFQMRLPPTNVCGYYYQLRARQITRPRSEATTKVVIKPQPHSQPQTSSRCSLVSTTSPDQKCYARLGAEGSEFPQTNNFQMVLVVREAVCLGNYKESHCWRPLGSGKEDGQPGTARSDSRTLASASSRRY